MLKNSPFSSWSKREPPRGFFKHVKVMNRLQCKDGFVGSKTTRTNAGCGVLSNSGLT